MLTFEPKLAIIESFPVLTRKNVSLGRVNFQYEESATDKKNVVYHLHPNGNGYVYAEDKARYDVDTKGMVNIRDFTENELEEIIEDALHALTATTLNEAAIIDNQVEERWINRDNHTLILINEDDMWNVYAGLNLDGTFLSYGEATNYLEEEGFSLKH